MSRVKEFVDRVETTDLLQLSGAVFVDHEVSWKGKKSLRKANTTPEEYCRVMGERNNMTTEEYANELLNFLDAPRTPVGDL